MSYDSSICSIQRLPAHARRPNLEHAASDRSISCRPPIQRNSCNRQLHFTQPALKNQAALRPAPNAEKPGAIFTQPEITARYTTDGEAPIAAYHSPVGRHIEFQQPKSAFRQVGRPQAAVRICAFHRTSFPEFHGNRSHHDQHVWTACRPGEGRGSINSPLRSGCNSITASYRRLATKLGQIGDFRRAFLPVT